MPLGLHHKQFLVNLKGQGDSYPTKQVMHTCWERVVVQVPSFGWTGELVAKDMGIDNKDFCPIAFWPLVPLWVLETPKIYLELLEAMLGNMNLDLVHK